MKRIRSALSATLAATLLCLSVPTVALASTGTSTPGSVRAEIDGQHVAAIDVGNITYLVWQALKDFHTPYAYLGGGLFSLTGKMVQGVVYRGDTYLPWNVTAPKVNAKHLRGGGFDFTQTAVKHDYQVYVFTQDGTVGTPDALQVYVADGNQLVPQQTVQISFDGNSYASNFNGKHTITVTTDPYGTWYGAIDDTSAETVHPVVTWTDPNGQIQTATQPVVFAAATASTSLVPAGSTIVATVPVTTFQNAVLFNAQSQGTDILFQLDTGSYEPLVTRQVAQLLNLPNLGSSAIQGIGGQDQAYNSQITLSIGGHEFQNIPCIVDNYYYGPSLFGYSFFSDHGYGLLIAPKNTSMTILQ